MAERAGLFESSGGDDFDLSSFTTKKTSPAPPVEAVRTVSEAAQFVSREPVVAAAAVPKKKKDRRHRTGRNEQLNIKVTAECLRLFYDLSDTHNWVQGETLERALAALQREIESTRQGNGKT
ncbi:MAG: stability/partitioning determinant [Acidobacteria bacterium]|nr:stability/partitioning determinant [Acidobacteriota bacterium]